MRTWLAPLIIATSLTAGTQVVQANQAPDAVERVWRTAQTGTAGNLPSLRTLRQACNADALCAARRIAQSTPRAKLQRAAPPDTDRIRLLKHSDSVRFNSPAPGEAIDISLHRFGRTAARDVRRVLALSPNARRITLDLRCNRGGDVARMLAVAGLFTGPVAHAVRLVNDRHTLPMDIDGDFPTAFDGTLTVLVGPETASSAEALAALLKRFGRATLVGQRTRGKNYTQLVIPVTHDWNLLYPSARIEISGIEWPDGLTPDIAAAPSSTSPASPGYPAGVSTRDTASCQPE